MKKVLLIVSFFPPLNRIASRRPAGFVKHLESYNWYPYVITRDWSNSKSYNESYLNSHLEKYIIGRSPIVKSGDIGNVHFYNHFKSWYEGMKYPISWTKYALEKAHYFLKNNKIDIIFSSSPTISNHYIASQIARKWDLPWVADFRDISGMLPPKHFFQNITIFRQKKWEKKVLKNCSKIISVNSGEILSKLISRHKKKVVLINNGFDSKYFLKEKFIELTKKFTLVFTGSLDRGISLKLVSVAIYQLYIEKKINIENIEFIFLGTKKIHLKDFFINDVIKNCTKVLSWTSYEKVCEYQSEATILLHAINVNIDGWISGKLMEYLGSKRPILSIAESKGEISKILQKTNSGMATNDLFELKRKLLEWYVEWDNKKTVTFKGVNKEIEKYSYLNLTKKLVEEFDDIIKCKKS